MQGAPGRDGQIQPAPDGQLQLQLEEEHIVHVVEDVWTIFWIFLTENDCPIAKLDINNAKNITIVSFIV